MTAQGRATPPGSPVLAGAPELRPARRRPGQLFGRAPRFPWSIPERAFVEPVVRQWTPFGALFLVNDPQLARDVLIAGQTDFPKAPVELDVFAALLGTGLLSLEGPAWRAHRRSLQPFFDVRATAQADALIADRVQELMTGWDRAGPGTPVAFHEAATHLALAVVVSRTFLTDGASIAGSVLEALSRVPKLMSMSALDAVPVIKEHRSQRRARQIGAAFADLTARIDDLIARRRATDSWPDDLASFLATRARNETGAPFNPAEIRGEIITALVAGHDTTASALTWAIYLLATHPAECARLEAELDETCAGRVPEAADLPRLIHTRAVVEETLRLFPPAPRLALRIAAAATQLGGHTVRRGDLIQILPWTLHRSAAIWGDPLRFRPDRFLPGSAMPVPRGAYMPFGAGPHVCIGQLTAMRQLQLILAAVCGRYRPELVGSSEIDISYNIILHPSGGLPVRLMPRRI